MRTELLGLLLFALSQPCIAQSPGPDLAKLAIRYVDAQEAVYERGAGQAQLDALISFYAPDYTYYHPQFGAKVAGLDNVRKGTASHLGESADAEIEIKGMLINGEMVSLALTESFADAATGKRLQRARMTVLTFKGDKIVQRVDI